MARTGVVLEMTSPGQLLALPRRPDLSLIERPPEASAEFGSVYRQIFDAPGGSGRSGWTDQRWRAELSQTGMRSWIARLADRTVGMAQLGWSGQGDAAIIVFGLVPDFQGQGIGGDLLGRLVSLLWETPAPNDRPTERAWLWTIPEEHPHNVPNYLARGFRFAQADDAQNWADHRG